MKLVQPQVGVLMTYSHNPQNPGASPQLLDTESEVPSRLMFRGLTIEFNSQVLAPRPWTEAQSAWADELLRDAPQGPVLELCAGVGHIGLGAVRDSSRSLVMVDFNSVAQWFAQDNAAANGLASRAEFRLARMEEALDTDERFALVIADPPWVPSDDTSKFPADPLDAIDGGDDGLDLARICVDLIDQHLAQDGSALLQLGNNEQVQRIANYAEHLPTGSVSVMEAQTFEDGVIVRLAR